MRVNISINPRLWRTFEQNKSVLIHFGELDIEMIKLDHLSQGDIDAEYVSPFGPRLFSPPSSCDMVKPMRVHIKRGYSRISI